MHVLVVRVFQVAVSLCYLLSTGVMPNVQRWTLLTFENPMSTIWVASEDKPATALPMHPFHQLWLSSGSTSMISHGDDAVVVLLDAAALDAAAPADLC